MDVDGIIALVKFKEFEIRFPFFWESYLSLELVFIMA